MSSNAQAASRMPSSSRPNSLAVSTTRMGLRRLPPLSAPWRIASTSRGGRAISPCKRNRVQYAFQNGFNPAALFRQVLLELNRHEVLQTVFPANAKFGFP